MDDLLREFLTECSESIATLDVELVNLEKTPDDPELLSNIFRLVHTIKGTCGFLGLPRLEKVAHSGENVLGKIRDGEMSVTPDAVTLILESIDRIKDILAELEANGTEPEGDDSVLIEQLNVLYQGGSPDVAPVDEPAAPVEESDSSPDIAVNDDSLFFRIGGEGAVEAAVDIFYRRVLADDSISHFFSGIDMAEQRGKQMSFLNMAFGGPNEYSGRDMREAHADLVANGLNEDHFNAVAGHLQATLDELGVPADIAGEVMAIAGSTHDDVLGIDAAIEAPAEEIVAIEETEEKVVARKPVETTAPVNAAAEAGGTADGAAREPSVAAQTIRVNVDQLETLMTTVSELVLTRNQLLQMVRSDEDSEFTAPLQRLSHITTDLQEGVMKTRMQPIGNAWAKLPRIVRALANDLDKKIDLDMLGADTELDRQVLELIKDPLTHMVRNSGDHGLENPADRIAAGKPETGRITLNAFHEGGHIIIEISDDGRGIDASKLRGKIIENGLATESELDSMTDLQIQQFIFKAGFSMAKEVTNVSGRGVGMDVVRTNIEKIGGTIALSTQVGKGSQFTIKIPLTLAIVSALIVEAGGERFAIPQLSVLELVRTKADSEHRIEQINGTPVLRLRDRLLPLTTLAAALKLPERSLVDDAESIVGNVDAATAEVDVETVENDADAPVVEEVAVSADGEMEQASEAFIVVSQVGTYTFGIVVDRVFDTEEIVVKPVSPILRDISMFSGNTILGDGSVIMILDPNGIAAASGLSVVI